MASKEIYIAQRRIGLGTSVKAGPEISQKTTQTFDGPKGTGIKKVPHTIEIGKLMCDNLDDYRELSELMVSMRDDPQTITISETTIGPDGSSFTVLKHYIGCLVTDASYEMKAEEYTAETLKFKSEDMTEEFPDS